MPTTEPKRCEKNRKRCLICSAEFFAYPSAERKSCGNRACTIALISQGVTRHGESNTRLYSIWSGMKSRCKGTAGGLANKYYAHVSLCDEWNSYSVFRQWATQNGYADDLEIDRKDSTKGYSPDNCRWASRSQQMQNVASRVRRNKTSVFKGVQRLVHTKKTWRALACIDGKPVQLGLFNTEEEAAREYDKWARQQYGEFANLNFK